MFLELLNALHFYIEDFVRRYTKTWGIAVNVTKYIQIYFSMEKGDGHCLHRNSVCAEFLKSKCDCQGWMPVYFL